MVAGQRLLAETDRIQHDLERALVILKVTIGRDKDKENYALGALYRDHPIRLAASQRRVVCEISGTRVLAIDSNVLMAANHSHIAIGLLKLFDEFVGGLF
jgi:hypothetical protein